MSGVWRVMMGGWSVEWGQGAQGLSTQQSKCLNASRQRRGDDLIKTINLIQPPDDKIKMDLFKAIL